MVRPTWPTPRSGAILRRTRPSRSSACATRPTGSTRPRAAPDAHASRRRRQHARLGTDRHREGGARIDRGLPARKLGIRRALDRKLEATLYDRAERDVREGETIEREPVAAGDVAVED